MRRILFIISITIFYNSCISFSDIERGSFIPATTELVKCDFEIHADLIFIQAEINGVTGIFLFDNGFSESGINKDFAERAQVTFNKTTRISDANKKSSSTPKAIVDTVNIRGHQFINTGFYQINTNRFFPCYPIDGVIGASIINKVNWKIDFDSQKMLISSQAFKSTGTSLDITFSNNNSSFTKITVLNQSYNCKIDLGSANEIKLDSKYSNDSFEGIMAEKRIGIMSLSAHGLGNVDSSYQIKDSLLVQHQDKTLPVKGKVLLRSKLKYQGYIGLNFFKPYELIINSTEKQYWIKPRTKELSAKSDSSYGIVIYPLEDQWKIIQLNPKDSLLKGIQLMDEIAMIDSLRMAQFKGICEYKEYLKTKIKSKGILKITLKGDKRVFELPLRSNTITEINLAD